MDVEFACGVHVGDYQIRTSRKMRDAAARDLEFAPSNPFEVG